MCRCAYAHALLRCSDFFFSAWGSSRLFIQSSLMPPRRTEAARLTCLMYGAACCWAKKCYTSLGQKRYFWLWVVWRRISSGDTRRDAEFIPSAMKYSYYRALCKNLLVRWNCEAAESAPANGSRQFIMNEYNFSEENELILQPLWMLNGDTRPFLIYLNWINKVDCYFREKKS